MVCVAAPLSEATQQALMKALLPLSAPPGSGSGLRPLEVTIVALGEVVPWRYAPRREMQFGEWLREDVLAGRFEGAQPDIDLAILFTKLRQHSIALHGPDAARLFEAVPASDVRRALAETIQMWNTEADWRGEERNVMLTLARIWFTASTGSITSKEAAASWAAERMRPEYGALMMDAANAYISGLDDRLARSPERVEEAIRNCKDEIARVLACPAVAPGAA